MNQKTWTAVDEYLSALFIPPDPIMDAVLKASDEGGLPQYQVSPPQGKLLMMLAQIHGSRTVLEVGTLGGYSTIWLARGLPAGGQVITLEGSPRHAQVAQANIKTAGFDQMVEVRVGHALDSLAQLVDEGHPPFDLIFLDADKENNPDYLRWSLKLARVGTLIIADNVVRDGDVIDKHMNDGDVKGTREFNTLLAQEKRVNAIAVQTVGSKGYDGFALGLVTG